MSFITRDKFAWKAEYLVGKTICQYEGNQETNFGIVSKAVEQLTIFLVGKHHGVNLITGEFLFDGHWQAIGDIDGNSLTPTELVYFRRHWVQVNPGTGKGSDTIQHFVGYKYSGGEVRLCIPEKGKAILCL